MASRNGLPGPLQSLFEEHDETLKLTLVTSVLNASSNWFFLHLLQGSFKEKHISEPQDVVVMFSFMRSWAFWKDCALKMGVDLDQAKHKGKLWFVDGLASSLPSSKLPQASERPHLPDDRNISQAIDDLSTSIEKAGAAASNQSKLIILIDQIDGLLAASSTLRAVDIESKISTWREVE
ncbi:MAG: hypothetical protein M1814_006278 [Vezdaea aestivalis]|nr:MAG: hypothetical protein M1814_006278 [Vezdaea aestivalis]